LKVYRQRITLFDLRFLSGWRPIQSVKDDDLNFQKDRDGIYSAYVQAPNAHAPPTAIKRKNDEEFGPATKVY